MKLILLFVLFILPLGAAAAEDITDRLQAAADRGGDVTVPSGTYRLSRTVKLGPDTRVAGSGNTVLLLDGSCNAFETGTRGKYTDRVSVSGLTFKCPSPSPVSALVAKQVRHLTVSRIKTENMAGVRVEHFSAARDTLNRDVTVSGCVFRGGGAPVQGVEIDWTDGFAVRDCRLEGFAHGIQWWGGDSDVRRGGLHSNMGFLKNGLIADCRVTDVEGGGIWGSMGENIVVRHCSVARCKDVGIDFEGCSESRAEDCDAGDCVNGNYATFQYCTGRIVFSGCRSTFSRAMNGVVGTCHYFNGNEVQLADYQDVTFEDCSFSSSVPSVIRPWHALHSFSLLRCAMTNTAADTDTPRLDLLRIQGCSFTFDSACEGPALTAAVCSPAAFSGPSVFVTDNTFTAPRGPAAVRIVKKSDPAAAYVFRGNKAKGFSEAPEVTNLGTEPLKDAGREQTPLIAQSS
ncbi:MAG: right-handed parallel beta-helix repeat-containing protein [Abditibacteriota bacterium]|nr:right-handed parallel beta-helix repeat-containing protein [Abditibacteriota bacterium]